MIFKPGDIVRFLNEEGEGKVLEIMGDGKIRVETADGFDYLYEAIQLVPTSNASDYNVTTEQVRDKMQEEGREKADKGFYKKFRHLEKMEKGEETWEIDLHIEQLIDSHHGMNNADILRVQISRLRSFIFRATERKIRRLIIIHGVGEGILRHEVHQVLLEDPNLEFFDADYKEYGYGATQVLIRYT